ncbi:MAG TPA: histidine kinase [Spirochaetia bacterium]|nr:histidine kinase [Spirochaetia bacterium]
MTPYVPERKPARFLAREVMTFLAPLLLAIAILGVLSARSSLSYVRSNLAQANANVLNQARDSIDAILDELNVTSLNFTINGRIQYSLRRILQRDTLGYDDLKELELIQNILSISQFSRPYIESIYVYFENPKHNFLTSDRGIVSVNTFYDTGWFSTYSRQKGNRLSWSEVRSIPTDSVTPTPTPVITFYRLVYNPAMHGYNGVVAINVYADKIRASLDSIETMQDQSILILDSQRQLVCATTDWNSALLAKTSNQTLPSATVTVGNEVYTVAQLHSKYDYLYVSVVPNNVLYRLPNYLFRLNIAYILAALIAGVLLSLTLARKSRIQIRTIVDTIESARNGHLKAPAAPEHKIRDSYEFILYNVISTFLEKDYLQIQLSEKNYKSRVDELIALQSQLNPHFLFNTLQTVNMRALALEQGSEISDMIEHLSRILRYSMGDPRKIVPMREEIDNAKSYLAIQTARYKDKIRVRWDYEESVLDHNTIKLLFQPLLENSIYHGIREQPFPGEIVISVESSDDLLMITVGDTGVGIEPGRLSEIQTHLRDTTGDFEHIGLYNTNRRIRLMFGPEYGMMIESQPGVGTLVHVRLPATWGAAALEDSR